MKLSHWKTKLIFSTVVLMILLGLGLSILSYRSTSSEVARTHSYTSFSESVAALKRTPNDPAALRGMARYYMHKRDYLKAVSYLRQVVGIEPDNTFNKLMLGVALKQAGQREEAIHVLDEVAATVGNNPERKAANGIARRMKSDPNWDAPAPTETLQITPHRYGT